MRSDLTKAGENRDILDDLIRGLEKGGRIERAQIEPLLDCTYDSKEFSLRIMALCSHVEQRLYEQGKQWVVRQEKGAIVVCTDVEAEEYLRRRQELAIGSIQRNQQRYQTIDLAALNDRTRQYHEQFELYIGRLLTSSDQIRRQLLASSDPEARRIEKDQP